jgi:DnaJ like chaperone protein
VSIWGKLLAGTFGFALGGPIGALLGVIAGHSVDKIRGQSSDIQGGVQSTQEVITVGVIILAAKLAKADGQVTSDEVLGF